MILREHLPYHKQIFGLEGFLSSPMLLLGFQLISNSCQSEFGGNEYLAEHFKQQGLEAQTLDLHDTRADIRHDLNEPLNQYEKYECVLDIGTLEHVFDTRQAIENCMRAVKVGGHYSLHTPVKGYCGHGLHTFHPHLFERLFVFNGFEVVYLKYTTPQGVEVFQPEGSKDLLIWIVGRKKERLEKLKVVQQDFNGVLKIHPEA